MHEGRSATVFSDTYLVDLGSDAGSSADAASDSEGD